MDRGAVDGAAEELDQVDQAVQIDRSSVLIEDGHIRPEQPIPGHGITGNW
jgi:hypothetical protein